MYAPMKMGFPTGMAGGGIAQFLQPLQEYLTQTVNSEKIQPFIDEISQLAQDRFDVDFGGGITNPGIGGGLFGGGMPSSLPPIDSSASSGVPTAQPYDHLAPTPMPPPATTIGNGHVGDGLGGMFNGGDMLNMPPPLPAVQNPGADNSGAYKIDQGFYDSQEYKAFNSGPKVGTQDVVFSPYFGQQGSGSISGQQDAAYEDYLRRTGQTDKIITTNPYAPPSIGLLPPPGFEGLFDGNGPGGVTLRPTPGVTPVDGLDMGVQMPPGFTPLPPGELGFTENMIGPLQAYTGGSKTFNESAPNMLSPIFRS